MTRTWTTLELRKAIEMGYVINNIYAATSYTPARGLMEQYMVHFLRMKICNIKPLNKEQCEEVNHYHKRIGFKGWKDIMPEETTNKNGLESSCETVPQQSLG